MKLLLLTTFVASLCYANAGKTQRLLAALNGGMLGGVNGLPMGGMNGGLLGGVNGLPMGGMNGLPMGGMNGANGAIPGMMAGGLNPVVAGGRAGFFGQPQFAQIVPGLPALALPAPVPNVYPAPAVNVFPYMGVPQMQPMNPPQQPLVGTAGGAMQQQLQAQPDPLRRFRRQIMKRNNIFKTTADTQIPAPTETMTTAACDEEGRQPEN